MIRDDERVQYSCRCLCRAVGSCAVMQADENCCNKTTAFVAICTKLPKTSHASRQAHEIVIVVERQSYTAFWYRLYVELRQVGAEKNTRLLHMSKCCTGSCYRNVGLSLTILCDCFYCLYYCIYHSNFHSNCRSTPLHCIFSMYDIFDASFVQPWCGSRWANMFTAHI